MELPTIDHPTGQSNFTEVTVGDVTVWFSYRSPVGFMSPGTGRVVRENDWGPTTGRHLNWITDGPRVPGETFNEMLAKALS